MTYFHAKNYVANGDSFLTHYLFAEFCNNNLQFEGICEVKSAKIGRHGETLHICTLRFARIEKRRVQIEKCKLVKRSPGMVKLELDLRLSMKYIIST